MGQDVFADRPVVLRLPLDNLTPEERDARTVFCMQLAARIRPRDLEEFFSAVGKVGSPDQETYHEVLLAPDGFSGAPSLTGFLSEQDHKSITA